MQSDIMDAMDFFRKQKQELDRLNSYCVPLRIKSQSAEFNVASVELVDGENGIELQITLMEKEENEEEENRPWFPVGTILYDEMILYEYDWKIEKCLPCDGREVLRSDYPSLFNAINDKYGEGDGKTTFNLPNLLPQKCSIVCKEMNV